MKIFIVSLFVISLLLLTSCSQSKVRDTSNAVPINDPSGVKDCGIDLDCFIASSSTCSETKVTNIQEFNLFGVMQTNKFYYELKGMKENKCIFYIKLEQVDLLFPPHIPKETSDEQNKVYDELEGRDGTCKFETQALTTMLTKWKAGDFTFDTDGGDFVNAECEGIYFSSTL